MVLIESTHTDTHVSDVYTGKMTGDKLEMDEFW